MTAHFSGQHMTASFGGVCNIPALNFLARLRLKSRFAEGKLEATSNTLRMESTPVFLSDRRLWLSHFVRISFLPLRHYVVPSLVSYACVQQLLIQFLIFFSFILGEIHLLKAETLHPWRVKRPSCLLQLTLFICDVEHIGVLPYSLEYLLVICRGLLRFFLVEGRVLQNISYRVISSDFGDQFDLFVFRMLLVIASHCRLC